MGGRRIDAPHARMGEARAHESGMVHARQLDVVDEFALARKKPRILRAQHARADGFPAHRPAPMPACPASHLRATRFRCTSFDKLWMEETTHRLQCDEDKERFEKKLG